MQQQVGLFLLYLWYQILKLFIPVLWKTKGNIKTQVRAKKGRKQTFAARRTWQRELGETIKLLSVVESRLSQKYDPTSFQQRLCPDSLCGVSTHEMTKVNHLLSRASLKDDDSDLSSWSSIASGDETSFTRPSPLRASPLGNTIPAPQSEQSPPSPSTLSPKPVVPLKDVPSAIPVDDSGTPESGSPLNSKLPVGHIPPQSLPSLSALPQYAVEKAKPLPQQAVLSLACRPSELFSDVQTSKHTDNTTHEMSKSSSTSPVDLVPLGRQDQRKEHSLTSAGKRKERDSFAKPPNTLGLGLVADPQDPTVSQSSQPLGEGEGKAEEQQKHEQSLDPHSAAGPAGPKHKEQFFGHPSLHSKSLGPRAPASTDCSSRSSCFNRTWDSPAYLHPTPLASSVTQILPQSHCQEVPPGKAKAQLQSPSVILPFSPVSQLRNDGEAFSRPPDEQKPLIPSQHNCMESNILKKEQESVCPLPSMVKISQEGICLPDPKFSLGSQSSQTHLPITIPRVDFPFSNEFQKKMEQHLQKRLIQQCWGLPNRILLSQSQLQLDPHTEASVSCESGGIYGLSWLSSIKCQRSMDLQRCAVKSPSIFQKRHSVTLPQQEVVEEQGLGAELVHQKDHLWSDPDGAPGEGEPRTEVENQSRGLSGKGSNICLTNTPRDVFPLKSSKQDDLEEPIKNCHMQRMSDLPVKVQKLIQNYNEISAINCQRSMDLQRCAVKSPAIFQKKHSVTLPQQEVVKEQGQGAELIHQKDHLWSDPDRAPGKGDPRTDLENQSRGLSGKGSNICLTNTPHDVILLRSSKRDDFEEPIKNCHMQMMSDLPVNVQKLIKNFNERSAPSQSQAPFHSCTALKSGMKSEPVIRKTLIGKSNDFSPDDIQTNNSLNLETDIKTEGVLRTISGPRDTKIPHFKNQLPSDLNPVSEGRHHVQAVYPAGIMPLASEGFSYKPLIIHYQCPSSGDMKESPVLPVLSSPGGIIMEQGKEDSQAPALVSDCMKNFPPPDKRKFPETSKIVLLGGGDTGLQFSQPREKRHSSQSRPPEETPGDISCNSLSQNGQAPHENCFSNQIKNFLQWLSPGRKRKASQKSVEKSSAASRVSMQGTGSLKGKDVFPPNTSGDRTTRNSEKVLKGELECRHGAIHVTENPSFPQKSGKSQVKDQLFSKGEPALSHHLNKQVPCSERTAAKTYSQAAAIAGQNSAIGHRDREPPKGVALLKKSFQRHPLTMPHRELEPLQNPTSISQPAHIPPTAFPCPRPCVGQFLPHK